MARAKQARGWRARTPGPGIAKLTMPRLGQLLSRARLLKQCDKLIEHKLVWIEAPAGSGKTTLLTEYLVSRKRTHLWYQVDAGDQDLASFFNNLATAAERSSRLKRKLSRFTPEYVLGLPAFSRNFFRDLFARLKNPACIVFDNYQEVGEAAVLDTVLAHALDELPEGITLVALSRGTLPAALARHDANGQVAHLDATALALTAEEEAALVKLTLGERRLEPVDLVRLHQATHGWMAGLLLVLREVRARPVGEEASVIGAITHTSVREPNYIFNYFASEVMARLDMATREFLYAVALFPAMTAALCEQLTGNQKAKTILQRLVHEHFFTTRRGLLSVNYEFHPLFRQFLLVQGENHIDQGQLKSLKRRAGQLLAEVGENEAVALLVDVQDWSTLTELICSQGVELEKQGRLLTLQKWIAALPETRLANDPWLLYWAGITQLMTDPFVAYEQFERAYAQFRAQDDATGLYKCWIGITTALFFRHDDMNPVPGWIAELEQLRERHPKWPSLEVKARVTTAALGILVVGDMQNPALPDWLTRTEKLYRLMPVGVVRCFVGHQLGIYYSVYGQLDKLSVLATQLDSLIASSRIPAVARFLAAAIPVFDRGQAGNLIKANEAISRGWSLLETSGVYVTSQWFYASAAMIRTSHGDLDGAEEFAERFRKNTNPRHRMELSFNEYMAGWRALVLGDFAAAKARSEASLVLIKPLHNVLSLLQALGVHVQALIDLGEVSEARTALDKFRALSQSTGNLLLAEFTANNMEAYFLDRSGGSLAEILPVLQQSFSAGARHQWVMDMCWQPRLIARLCDIALQHGIEPEYARRLIRIYHLVPPTSVVPSEQWPWPVRIHTLDRFAVQVDDKSVPLDAKGQKKPFELLKIIIALGARDVPLSRVLEELWPEAEGDAALRNFTIALHRLRQFVGTDSVLFAEQRLSLDARRVWVDLWPLERQLSELEALLTRGDTAQYRERQMEICKRYRRPFLDGEEAVWAVSRRERLRNKLLRVIESGAEALSRVQDHHAAIACSERGLEIEPLSERLYRALMKSQFALGEHAAVVATYRRCRASLQRELGVTPSVATEALYQQAIADK